jgi:hypothetical protein
MGSRRGEGAECVAILRDAAKRPLLRMTAQLFHDDATSSIVILRCSPSSASLEGWPQAISP